MHFAVFVRVNLVIGLLIFVLIQLLNMAAHAAFHPSDCEKEIMRATFWGDTPRLQMVKKPGHQELIWMKVKKGQIAEAQAIEQDIVETLSQGQVIDLMTADLRFLLLRFENDIQAIAKSKGVTGSALGTTFFGLPTLSG